MKENEKQSADEDGIPSAADFVRAARSELQDGNRKAAYKLLHTAYAHYHDNPVILSYFGCLQAIVDQKHRTGAEHCRKALYMLKKERASTANTLYPTLYLNLGRVNLAARKKKEAVDAFQKGLQYDKRNSELLKEMQALGVRKKPAVPFLSRSNPINKYIGMLLHNEKSQPGKKGSTRRS